VAYQGKLITVQDVMGVVANGTGAPRATLQPDLLRVLSGIWADWRGSERSRQRPVRGTCMSNAPLAGMVSQADGRPPQALPSPRPPRQNWTRQISSSAALWPAQRWSTTWLRSPRSNPSRTILSLSTSIPYHIPYMRSGPCWLLAVRALRCAGSAARGDADQSSFSTRLRLSCTWYPLWALHKCCSS